MLFIFQEPVLPPDLITWLLLIGIGFCGCFGHTTLNKGAQLIDASRTSVLRNADIAFVLVWQFIFLGELPTGWSWIGVILISASTIIGSLTRNQAPKAEILPEVTEIEMEELGELDEVEEKE